MKYLLILLLIVAISMIAIGGIINAIIAPVLTGIGFIIIAFILKK